ncbi:MAG TPA: methyltransferase, partial [Feifaniaceae bacterium]|nr:methyltransferase [Feifaniaceae bacterium]
MGAEPRLEDLQYKGLFLYQRGDLPRFTQDSVLLSSFSDLSADDTALDLGAGTGAVALLVYARTGAKFACLEREPALCELLRMTMARNKLAFPVHEMDWADAPERLGRHSFTAIVCNPPYFEKDLQSPDALRAAARGGLDALQNAAVCAGKLLKHGGKFYICYPAGRLADAFFLLRQNKLEPKRLRLVAYNAKKPPYLALILARKGGRPGMK